MVLTQLKHALSAQKLSSAHKTSMMTALAGRPLSTSSREEIQHDTRRYWPDKTYKEGFSLAPSLTMNYLKNLTTSVLSSTGVSFPFSIGERIPGLEPGSSIWELREGVKKVSRVRAGNQVGTCLIGLQDDGTLLTLFIFDATLPPLQPGNKDRRTLMQLARNGLKKLRTIRHPDV